MERSDKIKEIFNIIKNKLDNDYKKIEIYMSNSGEEEFTVRERDLDKYTFAESGGIGLRLIKNGQVGISFTEKIDFNDENINNLINNAKNSLKYAPSEPEFNTLIEESEEKAYNLINSDITNLTNDELKKISLSIEDKIYSL